MTDKIKCTYDDCFKHFKTEAAMKKHKAKDDLHDFFCKRCDVDCTDDTELLYHQITSPKHMACPVCGREFKSEGGRDRHVEIEHVPTQKITCVGCRKTFPRAGALMSHIERNECEAIKAVHFHHQRSEKETSKDAWEAALEPTAGATILSSNEIVPAGDAHLTLLDDERAYVNHNWQGELDNTDEENNGPYVGAGIEDRLSEHPVNRYPALVNHSQRGSEVSRGWPVEKEDSMISTRRPEFPPLRQNLDNNWSQNTHRSPSDVVWAGPIPETASETSINLLRGFKVDNASQATWGTTSQSKNNYNTHRSATNSVLSIHRRTSKLPSSASHDGNDPPSRIETVHSTPMPSYLSISSLWDPVQENYACPGRNCGNRFTTTAEFEHHLHTDKAHVVSTVSCPSCLKQFKTTAALLSHAESGSRKCKVRNCLDFDRVIREATAGLMITDGYAEDGSIRFAAAEVEDW